MTDEVLAGFAAHRSKVPSLAVMIVLSAQLVGCGGSGDDSSAPPAAPTVSISLAPTTVGPGQTSTLNWSSTAATQCSASGAWSGTTATTGTQQVSQNTAGIYSYTVTCTGPGGSTASSAALTVDASKPVISISVTPSTISTDHTATLTWTAINSTSCTASGAWSGLQGVSGSMTVGAPTPGAYPYTLACTNGSASTSNSATLTVVSPQVLTTTLTANPTSIAVGQSTTLTWSSNGADSCVASGAWSGNLPASGSQLVTVTGVGVNSYSLQCVTATGDGSAVAMVQGLQSTVNLSASQTTAGAGQSVTLSWSSTQAQSCTASGEWSGTFSASGSQNVTVGSLGPHTYNLSCANPGAAAQASVTLTAVVPTVSFSVFPANVVAGKTATLRWQAQYAISCTASGDWSAAINTSGFDTLTMVSPGTQSYHISCSNAGASAAQDVAVTIVAAPASPPATAYRMDESHDGVLLTTNGISQPATSAPTWTMSFGAPVSYSLIANGMVFVASANPNQSYGNMLYGLNGTTGAVVWGPVSVPGVYFGSGLSYDNGTVFILMFDGGLRAFDASTGAALWTTQLPGYWYDGSPNAYGGIVFVDGNTGISAVDETSGAILWTGGISTTNWISPAVSSEGVDVQDGDSCNAGAFDALTGTTVWATHGTCSGIWGFTSVLKDGTLFGRNEGTLNLFNAETGAAETQMASSLAPAVTTTAVIALNAGTLSSTRLSDRVQTWTFSGDGHLVTAPVVVNNTVFVGSSSGNVYGLDVGTGAQIWMGVSATPISPDSETGGPMPPSGPAAGEALLIFPTGNSIAAWQLQ